MPEQAKEALHAAEQERSQEICAALEAITGLEWRRRKSCYKDAIGYVSNVLANGKLVSCSDCTVYDDVWDIAKYHNIQGCDFSIDTVYGFIENLSIESFDGRGADDFLLFFKKSAAIRDSFKTITDAPIHSEVIQAMSLDLNQAANSIYFKLLTSKLYQNRDSVNQRVNQSMLQPTGA